MPRKPAAAAVKRFVLDTNVLIHSSESLLRFHKNDVYIPFVVLEELDKFKQGIEERNRNARAAVRLLDEATRQPGDMVKGFELSGLNGGGATGKLFLLKDEPAVPGKDGYHLDPKADNRILHAAISLSKQAPATKVVLVTKDFNLRIKARAMGLETDDYLHDHAVENSDLLPRGHRSVTTREYEDMLVSANSIRGLDVLEVVQPAEALYLNEFISEGEAGAFRVAETSGSRAVLHRATNYMNAKHNVFGITARNGEQSYALNLLMDPEVDFVALLGQAGTGKTLLTVAAGLQQCLEPSHRRYSEILFTRATVPVGDDIGYLPGGEEEKMAAWMGALHDSLEVLTGTGGMGQEFESKVTLELVQQRVKVKSMSFMRGRSFQNKFLVVDEAQNLTPKQVKTLVTRAGNGTKLILMGDIAQIDTPYLSETSSGLTYAVQAMKGWKHAASLILSKGERSRLATYAAEHL